VGRIELKINPSLIENPEELRRIFEEYLPLGKAEVADVQNFLREQGFSFSDLHERGDPAIRIFYSEMNPKPFDSLIGCRIPGPRRHWHWPGWSLKALFDEIIGYLTISSAYFLQFHFLDNRLVEIMVERHFTGF
jgi:hypothetical protein